MEERRHYLYTAAYNLINQSQFLHPIRGDFSNQAQLSGPIRRELTNRKLSQPIRNELTNIRQDSEPMRSSVTQLPPHLRLPPSIEQKMNNNSIRLSGPNTNHQQLLPFNVKSFLLN